MHQISGLPVLMYHSVPAETQGGLDVPLARLRSHLRMLVDNGFTVLGLTDALAAHAREPARAVVGLTFDDGYTSFIDAVEVLADVGARASMYLPTAHLRTRENASYLDRRLMSWAQVRQLPSQIIELGAHSHHHVPMDVLPRTVLLQEVAASRTALQERTGITPASFCYPHGYADRRVRNAVADAGFENACIVGRRVADARCDPYAVPRLQVRADLSDRELLALVARGEPGLAPAAKRVLTPPWRWTRRAVHATTGRVLT